jgi:hypothetical protein
VAQATRLWYSPSGGFPFPQLLSVLPPIRTGASARGPRLRQILTPPRSPHALAVQGRRPGQPSSSLHRRSLVLRSEVIVWPVARGSDLERGLPAPGGEGTSQSSICVHSCFVAKWPPALRSMAVRHKTGFQPPWPSAEQALRRVASASTNTTLADAVVFMLGGTHPKFMKSGMTVRWTSLLAPGITSKRRAAIAR